MSRVMRKHFLAYAKTKTQISCAVTAQLISAFVFVTWKVQSIFFLYPKFQAFSYLLLLYSRVCVTPGRKPRIPVFSQRGSNDVHHKIQIYNACSESFSRESARVMQYLSFSLLDGSVPDYDFFFAIITVCGTFLVNKLKLCNLCFLTAYPFQNLKSQLLFICVSFSKIENKPPPPPKKKKTKKQQTKQTTTKKKKKKKKNEYVFAARFSI